MRGMRGTDSKEPHQTLGTWGWKTGGGEVNPFRVTTPSWFYCRAVAGKPGWSKNPEDFPAPGLTIF